MGEAFVSYLCFPMLLVYLKNMLNTEKHAKGWISVLFHLQYEASAFFDLIPTSFPKCVNQSSDGCTYLFIALEEQSPLKDSMYGSIS